MSPKPKHKRERERYPSLMDALYRLPQSSQRLDLGALSIVTIVTEGYLDRRAERQETDSLTDKGV